MPFNTAPALEYFLPNISSTVCFPIRRVLLRLAPGSTIACLAERAPAEKLSLYQPNRQSKLEMFQQEVEELFFFQTGPGVDTKMCLTSWCRRVIWGVPSNPDAGMYEIKIDAHLPQDSQPVLIGIWAFFAISLPLQKAGLFASDHKYEPYNFYI